MNWSVQVHSSCLFKQMHLLQSTQLPGPSLAASTCFVLRCQVPHRCGIGFHRTVLWSICGTHAAFLCPHPSRMLGIFPSSVGYTVFGRSLAVVVSYYFARRFGSLFCVDRVLLAVYATIFFVLPIGRLKG